MTLDYTLRLIGAICAGAMAATVAVRRRRSIAQAAFVAGMALLGVECVFSALSGSTPLLQKATEWQLWRLTAMAFTPGVWLIFSLSYSRGNAQEFLSKWRFAILVALLLPALLIVPLRHDLIIPAQQLAAGKHLLFQLGGSGIVLYLLELTGSIVVLMNLERTFHASVGTMRWRVKFMLLGVGALFVVRAYVSSQALLFRRIDMSVESLNYGTLLVSALLILRSFFRSGHFEFNVYPSRSILQGSITVLLAGIYLLGVAIFAKAVSYIGGDAAFALKAFLLLVSLVILVALLQSDRLRMRLGQFVSRHFQRPLYDYRTVWRRFTESTASQVDHAELSRSLVKLAADIFQCLSVALWIVDDKNESLILAASTFLSDSKGRDLALSRAEAGEVVAHFLEHPEPLGIDVRKDDFALLLRRAHPSEFPTRENRVCLPMISRGQVIALMVLGDRVGGATFSSQDLDMLKCVGDHATASLLNVQLAQRLLQAKEMEAFQTMAAFFVHDLKNAASTLSLMLKNLPVHFEDPGIPGGRPARDSPNRCRTSII